MGGIVTVLQSTLKNPKTFKIHKIQQVLIGCPLYHDEEYIVFAQKLLIYSWGDIQIGSVAQIGAMTKIRT